MRRFLLLLLNELKLARTAIPIHLVAIVQPTVLFLLSSLIMVHPTFDMNVAQPSTEQGRALVQAMREVGSPIGLPYINPILVDVAEPGNLRQVVAIELRGGIPTAVQRFGLIDSNQVKNLRNRLTAASLRLWNTALGKRAVTIEEHTWLPHDLPYTLYLGMALLPTATFVAAMFIGGALTAQDSELRMIAEYSLAPIAILWILGARLVRLVLSGLIAAGLLLFSLGGLTGIWPDSPLLVALVLLPVAAIAGSLGITVGLLLGRSIPTFVIGLTASLAGWILGSGFGPAASFGGILEKIGWLVPHTYAVELLFARYYGVEIGHPWRAAIALPLFSLAMLTLVFLAYRWRVIRRD